MSNSNLEALVEAVKHDAAARESLKSANDQEAFKKAMLAYANEKGIEVSAEDLNQLHVAGQSKKLSEDELDQVSGGGSGFSGSPSTEWGFCTWKTEHCTLSSGC